MKNLISTFVCLVGLISLSQAQIPSVDISTLDGSTFNTSAIDNEGKPIIISFWATWCKPCIRELKAIQKEYEIWNKETGVRLIAIAIDDERTKSEVGPRIETFGWETYTVYLDPNSDFKRAMNVVNVPHTFLLDGEKKIISQHTAYAPGDEILLYEEIKKLVGK